MDSMGLVSEDESKFTKIALSHLKEKDGTWSRFDIRENYRVREHNGTKLPTHFRKS